MNTFILAIDQGTTGSTALILDKNLNVLSKKNTEFAQYYPKPGWVEHSPEEIWDSVLQSVGKALKEASIDAHQISCIGITNQRETTLLWDRKTGKPIHKAIVWQDRRTAPFCEALKKKGFEKKIKNLTGLVLDPYFSGTKIKWMLDNIPGARKRAEKGELCFGTIDSFLVWKLTGGHSHVTDISNASRTLLMNLKTGEWDESLLRIFNVPKNILPKICPNAFDFGKTKGLGILPDGIAITGMAGDQQSALFGQACFQIGEAKCTYGTGSFILMNVGDKPVFSKNGLLSSVGWKLGSKTTYVLEGSSFIAGAAVQWLRDGLQIIQKASEIEALAKTVSDNGGVVFVPALAGLGAPYWRASARGVIHGITRGTTKAHIARAALEGIAFQQAEVLSAMEKDSRKKCRGLKVDGGASQNNLLMQFQADILGVKIIRPKMVETTALGAAFLAGLGAGVWKNLDELKKSFKQDMAFDPKFSLKRREELKEKWNQVVAKA